MTREEAINNLKRAGECLDMTYANEQEKEELEAINMGIEALEQEPKTGHWITWKEAGNEIASETKFECSVCHDSAQTLCNGLDLLSPYCPNCGAKMESEGKE